MKATTSWYFLGPLLVFATSHSEARTTEKPTVSTPHKAKNTPKPTASRGTPQQAPEVAATKAEPKIASPAIEDVVVTSQHRQERIQDIPISITAFDAKTLKKFNLKSSDDLASHLTDVQIAMPSGKGNQPLIAIRGIGLNDTNTNNAGPNGVYVDGIYEASPAGQTFQTFDLERVEVLKGPQGTLYGRNTTGGAISYVTAKPTDKFYANQDIEYGSWNSVSMTSILNGKIADGVDGRVAINYNYSDGYFRDLTDNNTTNGANDLAYRGQIKAKPADDLTLLFNFHGGLVSRRPDEYRNVGTFNGAFGDTCSNSAITAGHCTDLYGYNGSKSFYKGYYNRDRPLWINAMGGSVQLEWSPGPFTLTSLTGYEVSHKIHPEDTDAGPNQILEIDYGVRSTDISQEFRVNGSGRRYHWLVGLYYLNEHLKQDQSLNELTDLDQILGMAGAGDGTSMATRTINGQFTQSVAAFSQVDYEILDRTHLTLGGRLTYEHKAFNDYTLASIEEGGVMPARTPLYSIQENLTNRAASWRVAIDHKFTNAIMAYGSISTGFKSGGFNGGFLDIDPVNAAYQLRPVKPEYVTAYEVGFKADFLRHRLRWNAAGFFNSYRDQQIYNLIPGSNGVALSTLGNAPRAQIKGVESEFDLTPIPRLTMQLNVSFLNAQLGRFTAGAGTPSAVSYRGNQLPNAPHITATMLAMYHVPFQNGDDLQFMLNSSYRSHQYFDSTNNPLVAQRAYWLFNGKITYALAKPNLQISFIGKNLTGEKYLNFMSNLSSGLGILEEVVGTPRYFGGEANYTF
ncbi:TonB-dependent receptor [Acetobacter garciniae]|uniref:TonB-dependent receptor n=1 Tax=Acetobacter garciniae TaxID=2817435 RepID=A0A939HQ97_9PROT|nr:TonB-dependent receptor [Acetobacter garciniae]MBO1325549.1 TonB-dependent receptor [Acetobacter garciniae]